ncbi:hypothetical protein D3C72_1579370 [compost metagenome]
MLAGPPSAKSKYPRSQPLFLIGPTAVAALWRPAASLGMLPSTDTLETCRNHVASYRLGRARPPYLPACTDSPRKKKRKNGKSGPRAALSVRILRYKPLVRADTHQSPYIVSTNPRRPARLPRRNEVSGDARFQFSFGLLAFLRAVFLATFLIAFLTGAF